MKRASCVSYFITQQDVLKDKKDEVVRSCDPQILAVPVNALEQRLDELTTPKVLAMRGREAPKATTAAPTQVGLSPSICVCVSVE